MAENKTGSRKTGKKAAASAAKVLNDPKSTKDQKAAAASALAQTRDGTESTDTRHPTPDTPPKRFVRFRATEKSPSVEIAAGEYRRIFRKEDEPFEVADDNELEMLRGTGHFVEDKEAEREADDSEA